MEIQFEKHRTSDKVEEIYYTIVIHGEDFLVGYANEFDTEADLIAAINKLLTKHDAINGTLLVKTDDGDNIDGEDYEMSDFFMIGDDYTRPDLDGARSKAIDILRERAEHGRRISAAARDEYSIDIYKFVDGSAVQSMTLTLRDGEITETEMA